MTGRFDEGRAPQLKEQVKINAGLYNGRTGEVREIDTPNKRVRVWAPGLMGQETVLLSWSDIAPIR